MMAQENQLPDGWVLATLGEVCSTIKGKKPKDTGGKSIERVTTYINIKTFETKNIGIYASSGNYPECKPNDILIVWDGARAGLIGRGVSGYIGSTLAKVFSKTLTNTYLFYFLIFQYGYINTNTKGVGIPHVDPTIFFNIEVPVPPSAEQHRIVAEIEKQFSRLDEAVAGLKRIQANLKRYRASVLKAAVEGKLTAEWRKQHSNTEPAEPLLQRILKERRAHWEQAELEKMQAAGKPPKDDKWKQKYKEPEQVKIVETYDIPHSWVWSNLGQIGWSVRDGPHYSPKYSEDGIPFISGRNIRPDGVDFSSAKYISAELHQELSCRCVPEYGDLLYTKGGTTGIACINKETRVFNVWVHVAVIKLIESIEKAYLQYALNSPFCYKQSQKYTHGVGNQDLGLTRMVWITIPLPPLLEQAQIVSEIERRLSITDEVEQQINTNLKRAERLRQAILKNAFSGKLVPQDPDDEPTSVLLEKIKQAQRA